MLLLLPARHGQGQGQPDPRQPGMLATGCMSAGLSTHLGLGLPLTPPEHEVGALGLVVASRLAQVRPILEAVVADLLGEEGGQQQVFAIGCTTRPLPPQLPPPHAEHSYSGLGAAAAATTSASLQGSLQVVRCSTGCHTLFHSPPEDCPGSVTGLWALDCCLGPAGGCSSSLLLLSFLSGSRALALGGPVWQVRVGVRVGVEGLGQG